MVGISCIEIIHAMINGITDHLHGRLLIDPGIIVVKYRETHATKAKRGDL
jgi:hypothetical protein